MEREHFRTANGTVYEKDGSVYYKSNGHFDPKGNPVMTRIPESVYDEAWADRVEETEDDPIPAPEPADEAPAPAEEAKEKTPADPGNLKVSVPDTLTDDEWERTVALFNSKVELERHAFGSDDLHLERSGNGKVTMVGTYPEGINPDITAAAMQYLVQLIDLAKKSQRVNHINGQPVNEKYAFRTWLLRLGFIGPDFKKSRATLLGNLTGSAAFRDGKAKKEEKGVG